MGTKNGDILRIYLSSAEGKGRLVFGKFKEALMDKASVSADDLQGKNTFEKVANYLESSQPTIWQSIVENQPLKFISEYKKAHPEDSGTPVKLKGPPLLQQDEQVAFQIARADLADVPSAGSDVDTSAGAGDGAGAGAGTSAGDGAGGAGTGAGADTGSARTSRTSGEGKRRRARSEPPTRAAGAGSGGPDVAKEQAAVAAQPVNQMPQTGMMQSATVLLNQPVPVQQPVQEPAPPVAAESPADESEDAVGQATTESTRQNELAANESATLEYKPNFTEVMDPAHMRLATDVSRGNLGAGTSAQMQSADLWGNQFTQPPQDLPVQPEQFLQTQPGGVTVEKGEDDAKQQDLYSFLPFAKLGGVIVWIPRHVQTAKFFFTSDDYAELTSHVRDGDPLTLDKTEEVDSTIMMSSIIKSYGTLKSFCQLGPMLPMTASIEQIYAEWLEMRQIGVAVGRYQQISGGMYENAELSMKGGIRAAVASALRPFVVAWNQIHTDAKDQIAMDVPADRPGVGIMTGTKRKAQAGVVEPEEYNPQFSFQPVDLKRVKFSIPTV